MKKVILTLCFISLIVIINSCSSGKYVASENGDKAEVTRKDGYKFVSEIVCIHDTAIIFSTISENRLHVQQLFYEPIDKIKSITIQGYGGSGWIGSVLVFQVLPAALLTVAATSVDSDNAGVGLIFAIPAVITAILFATSEGETPQWNNELPISEIENLKKYSRYPEGMNQEVLSKLLKKYNQTGITRIIRR